MRDIFVRRRRLNYLALAWGIWKIPQAAEKWKEVYPLYARRAGAHLTFAWLCSMQLHRVRRRWNRWKRTITWLIYNDRAQAVRAVLFLPPPAQSVRPL